MILFVFLYITTGVSLSVICNYIHKTTKLEAFFFFSLWPVAIALVAMTIAMPLDDDSVKW